MARTTFVIRDGALVEKRYAPVPGGPAIRTDGMDATECPADGRIYDSKSAYYAAVKRAGCDILGSTEAPPSRRSDTGPSVEHSMRQALEQLRSR